MGRLCVFLILLTGVEICQSQLLNNTRRTDWSKVGVKQKPTLNSINVNITSYGGDKSGMTDNTSAINAAITAIGNGGGTIYFPTGVYLYTSPISLPSNIKLKGASSDSTFFRFNLSGSNSNCINVIGTTLTTTRDIVSGTHMGSKTLSLNNMNGLQVGDYVEIRVDGTGFMTSSWAMNDLAQINQIESISGNTLTLSSPLRWHFNQSTNPKLYKLNPAKNVGLECFNITRIDSSSTQTSLINFNMATNCWVSGVEGYKTMFSHIELSKSFRCEIVQSYFHHSWDYGGNGRGYGICIQSSSSECLIVNNVFEHLRHSTLFQSGANGNVIGYNYSTDPFWTGNVTTPSNSAGEITFHGNFPFMNLVEGNIVDNIVIDNSHGANGPFNTIFRNRGQNYGIFMNASAGDSTNIIHNELLKSSVSFTVFGFPVTISTYTITGSGNFEYGNNHNNTTRPTSTQAPTDIASYFLSATPKWFAMDTIGNIGYPRTLNSGNTPSKIRYTTSNVSKTICPQLDSTICKIQYSIKSQVHLCDGDSILLIDSNKTTTKIWAPTPYNIISKDSLILKPTTTTTYHFYIEDTQNCPNVKDSIIVFIYPKYQQKIFDTICQGDSLFFNNYFRTDIGPYNDTLVSIHGCDSIIQLDLFVRPSPTIQLTLSDTTVIQGTPVRVTAFGGGSYLWRPFYRMMPSADSPSVWLFPDVDTTYIVRIMDENGCQDSKTVSIKLIHPPSTIIGNTTSSIHIFPTVVSNELHIESEEPILITISDNVGRKLYTTKSQTNRTKLSLSNWNNGIYILECGQKNNERYFFKIIVAH